jgi:hypothetical protein
MKCKVKQKHRLHFILIPLVNKPVLYNTIDRK